MTEKIGKCHDCTAPQTEVNMLSRHILELQADKGRLTDKVNELEQQIEKMKCCKNCKHFDFNEPNYCHKGVYRERQYVCSKWEFDN